MCARLFVFLNLCFYCGRLGFFTNSNNLMKVFFEKLRRWLSRLSFRTGVIVLLCCIPCYILSFAQMALPISTELKGVLWFVLFGMAKTLQYGGLTILGVEGVKRFKQWFRSLKNHNTN